MLTEDLDPAVFSTRGKRGRGLPAEPGARWFVAQVKPRLEKRFAHELRAKCVSYFLPMQACKISDGGKMRDGWKLMMTGICFVLANSDDYYLMRGTRRLWGVLKTNDQIGLRADLRKLVRFMRSLSMQRFEKITSGRLVRVRTDCPIKSLRGLEAKVDHRDGSRVYVDIRMVGAAVFQVDAKYLEVI